MLKLDQLPWVSCNMSYLIYIDRIHAGCFYSLGLSLNSLELLDLPRAYFFRSVHRVLLLSVGEHSNHLGLGHLLQRWICPSSANNCKNSELICCNRGMGEKWSWQKKVNGDKVVFFCHSVCFSPEDSGHQSQAIQDLLLWNLANARMHIIRPPSLSSSGGGRGLNIKRPVGFMDLSLTGSRGAQTFFPALCRQRGQSPNSFPVIVLCSQLGQRKRPLTGFPNGPEQEEKMTATLPPRNVTSLTSLLFNWLIVFDVTAAFSQLLLGILAACLLLYWQGFRCWTNLSETALIFFYLTLS